MKMTLGEACVWTIIAVLVALCCTGIWDVIK